MSKVMALSKRTWQESHDGTQYTFKDIHELLAFMSHEIHASGRRYRDIAIGAKCCDSTVSKLARGDTRFPRAQTILEVLRTLGFKVVVQS